MYTFCKLCRSAYRFSKVLATEPARISSILGASVLLVFWLCGLAIASQGSPVSQCPPEATVVLSGIQGAAGSTVGPDGALYVTEGVTGSILRVDPVTGASTVFATGLPVQLPAGRGFGGSVDVVFVDGTAYALASLVGPILEGDLDALAGIYRIDGPNNVTLMENIAAFNKANPPDTEFFLPIGVQYALETYRGDLLVTDGHLNRVLRVTTDGEISVMEAFGNVVPTGMDVRWNTIFMAQAGPIPHLPKSGKVVAFNELTEPSEIASGARLNVDAEFGSSDNSFTLFGLAQGIHPEGASDGAPALPNTGALMRANDGGVFEVVYEPLNLPTSVEFIGNSAYVVGLDGNIVKIDNLSCAPPED